MLLCIYNGFKGKTHPIIADKTRQQEILILLVIMIQKKCDTKRKNYRYLKKMIKKRGELIK